MSCLPHRHSGTTSDSDLSRMAWRSGSVSEVALSKVSTLLSPWRFFTVRASIIHLYKPPSVCPTHEHDHMHQFLCKYILNQMVCISLCMCWTGRVQRGGVLEGPVYLPKSLRRPECHAAASWSTAWKDMGQMGAV